MGTGRIDLPEGFRHCFKVPPSRKQEIYFLILQMTLPFIRNTQTWPLWRRLRSGNVYAESELVHNLHSLVFDPDFTERDIWWLETQAVIFRKIRSRKPFGQSEAILLLIDELWGISGVEQGQNLQPSADA